MTATWPISVDPSNTEQLTAWDGDEGSYWAENADHFDRALAGYHDQFLAAAEITSAERVLDIGCGTGQTTRDAARAASTGSALGVDLSARMIDHARARAVSEAVTNAAFVQADAQIHPFDADAYEVAISRTGAMFFGDPCAAFTNIGRALVRGGRLVLLVWQGPAANEWIREISSALALGRTLPAPSPDAPGPFSLSDPDRVGTLLSGAGFADIDLEGTTRGMWFGADASDAHRFVLGQMGWMLRGLDRSDQARAVEALGTTLEAHETAGGVVFGSAAWIVRATRVS